MYQCVTPKMVLLFLPLKTLISVGPEKNVQFLRHFQGGQFATYPVAQGLEFLDGN